MQIAFVAGEFSTGLHGKIDAAGLYESRALTGSESSFFNAARGLHERGHFVTVYCDVVAPMPKCEKLGGASVFPISDKIGDRYDVYVSLNEPEQLRRAPSDHLRIVQMQYNDFNFCQDRDFDRYVDAYATLSRPHGEHLLRVTPELTPSKIACVPNSINVEMFLGHEVRDPHAMVWCSSPDRGLHRLLDIFPDIRARVPDATLKIFYRFDPWYERFKGEEGEFGNRARYIGECLRRLGRNGENGVTLVGPIPNVKMARELMRAGVLPYTCDTVGFTEGFSVSIMDACAAGCVPIISDVDAIGHIYKDTAHIIPGRPGEKRTDWIAAIYRAMTDKAWAEGISTRVAKFSEDFDRRNVAGDWEALFRDRMGSDKPRDLYQKAKDEAWGAPKNVPPSLVAALAPLQDATARLEKSVAAAVPALIPAPVAGRPTYKHQLRIALIMGKQSSVVHGVFDVETLYEQGYMTGTGLTFWNTAWGLAERGHTVDVFCEAKARAIGAQNLGGANVYPLDDPGVGIGDTYDAYISVNEPDLLRPFPKDRLRICQQLLNDFTYCFPGFDDAVDLYACPSDRHMRYLADTTQVSPEKMVIVPLSINTEFYSSTAPRQPHSIAYTSSPDRGLHHLLEMFPEIRKRVPDATLKIYYRFRPWLDSMLACDLPTVMPMRRRAESIARSLNELGQNGQNGVHLLGPVPPMTMVRELMQTQVMAYPCDPTRFTEGFSVAVLDACAAGCVPIVAAVDVFPDIWGGVVHMIPGNPMEQREAWLDAIVAGLTDENFANGIRYPAKAYAKNFTRQNMARTWETLIRERRKA